ncbi:MAG: DUF1850 domain-containing protein [Synergistaceae bacterium]|jgi:hypothetical protein|nr:DUF1850 domain-containing protein [Synergistaceae bacterium]
MRTLWIAVLGLSLLFCCICPVSHVELAEKDGRAVLSFPIYVGETFSTEYIHSVQLCPVVDVYYVTGNALRLWEERTQSTNAGLPTEAPVNGRFLHQPPWYRYIGGGRAFSSVRYRVGTAEIGRNILTLPSRRKIALYELFEGRLLTLRTRPR